ncbi:MAG: L-seryl-tRNA(Sec) selenium transferase [Archangium sp.]|nr:L-seryl-tRNA(Sec) selenium transferase [Archangium sp.]
MDDETRMERLRALPSIDELLARPSLSSLLSPHSRPVAVAALREAVASVRTRVLAGEDASLDEGDVATALKRVGQPKLKPVLNATGVVLHTNLGRAPLPVAAIERIAAIAGGYCNLELDLDEGERGSRYEPVVELLCALTGAEDAMVVNNCAAAVLLTFSALAHGREAIVSRGELVEIGGGFRIPDVMRQSGATLIEVGTTNRTRLADYAAQLSDRTGLLVKVHRSNFAIVGFSEEATTRELAELATGRGVPLFEDLGSGALRSLHADGLSSEPTVASVIAAGAHVVAFSADKLLGGPQAGLIVGKKATLDRLKQHPLNRALRIDKLTVAALEATLELYRDGREDEAIPTRALLLARPGVLLARAQKLSALLGAIPHRVVETAGRVGGGSMPLAAPKSWAVALSNVRATSLHEKLRAGDPPVIARIVDDEVWLDVRCLDDTSLDAVARAVRGD